MQAELAAFRDRLEAIDQDDFDAATEPLVEDLWTAYEELRVADEEVRVQQDQISELLEGQHLLRWQQERMTAVLPVPVFMTDRLGVIRTVNASAATLVQARVARLVGKPMLALLAPEDRNDVRRLLSHLSAAGSSFHRVVTLIAPMGETSSAEAYVSRLPGPSPELSWMLLVGSATEGTRSTGPAVPETLSKLALIPTEVSDDQDALARAVAICQDTLGPTMSVSASKGSPDAPTAVATTSRLAQTFDGAQTTVGQGPSLTAFTEATTIEAPDVHRDLRWPRLAKAAPQEVRGVLAVPLMVGDDLVGTLDVYPTELTWPPRLREDVELMASTLAAVLFELGLKKELVRLADELEHALQSRATIDQAKGIVMADRRIDAEAAFEHLVRLSSSRHIKLREVAEEIVRRASE
jgi:PAS domain-containing protein